MERSHVALVNRQIARSDFNVEDVGKALEGDFNPNIQWEQDDIDGPRQNGGTAAVLLKYGAQIDLRNALVRTPLHEAIFGCGWHPPLYEAIRTWNLQAAELLVKGGADLNQTSPGGWTTLDLALLERNEPIINLLYRCGARFSEDAASSEDISPESLREMAQRLLADTNIFPPSTCRTVYLYVIRQLEFLDSFTEYSTSSASNCTVILDTFFPLLSRKAEKPNPEDVPGAPKCTQCVKYLKESSPMMSGPFKLYRNRSSLSQSAREGCCMCAVFEDALVHKSGRWPQIRPKFSTDGEFG
ncbi:hypothetical protein HD806DRAFT_549305 [Xylariaceae sp. AK1471]|nr:hypothetical protein HD806DRAFT_549305 [Xylariaceae sp. AK1471]